MFDVNFLHIVVAIQFIVSGKPCVAVLAECS